MDVDTGKRAAEILEDWQGLAQKMREIGDEEMRALMVLKATVDDPMIDDAAPRSAARTSEWDLWDEITGLPLDEGRVLKGGRKVRHDRSVEWVRGQRVPEQIGAAPIAGRWDVINQGDATNVDIRARLMVKQFKKTSVYSIFAPTLLLAAFRLLCSPVLTNRGRSKELLRLLPNTHSRADVRETTPPAGDDALLARQEGDVRHPIGI